MTDERRPHRPFENSPRRSSQGACGGNQVVATHIAASISSVYQAMSDLGKPAAETESPRTPALPIRQSVRRDYVVCLECGCRGQMLLRHVTTAHGLSLPEYRARWNLPSDHPMTATGYSERRSRMAKQIGLGRGRRRAKSPRLPKRQPRRRPSERVAVADDRERQKLIGQREI